MIPAVAPTCTATGLTEGTKCSVCDLVLTEQEEVEALGHVLEFVANIEGKEPTCTASGRGDFLCTRCNKHKEMDVPAYGHAFVEYRVEEPTCTANGRIFKECERCGLIQTERPDPLGHTEEIIPAVEATCTATGLTEGMKCSVCDAVLKEQEVIPMVDHTWKTYEAKDATCTEDGHNAYQECTVCQTTQNKEVYPAGHKFENYKCTVCGQRDTSCEHEDAVIKYTAPTCTDAGSQSFWCPDCNYEKIEILAKLDHQKVDKSVAGTCITMGREHVVCAVCNQDLVNVETGYGSHNIVNGKCTVCGTIECDHSSCTTHTEHPTCSEDGATTKICDVCGTIVSIENLAAVGHKLVNGICSVCGYLDSNRITSDYQNIFVVG